MGDFWTRFRAYKDYIGIYTALATALGLLLTRLGATAQTISAILTVAAVAFALFLWLRPRIFPTWRLLELCLYTDQRFPAMRAIDDSLYCFWWAAVRRRGFGLRTFDVARLRVEAELLTGGKGRESATAERSWQQHLEAMLDERELVLYGLRLDNRFHTEIPDCLPLAAPGAFESIDDYFKALISAGRPDDHFLSDVRVKSAYVAPLYLLTGQLSHFNQNWRDIVDAYSDVTSHFDPIAEDSLRHLRAFQFACWIVWGPSIPICTCQSWNHNGKDAIGFQLGYGDENTSVILYDERRFLRLRLQRARHRVAKTLAATASPLSALPVIAPLAVRLTASVVVRRPGSGNPARLCQAQGDLADRLVLDFREIDVVEGAGRSYYSAYLWVMFVLETSPGHLLMSDGEPWRALLPFFVHGNIADASTYAFLKERLANEALDAIEAVVQGPGTPAGVTFVYMSAIDHPGCGHKPLMADPGDPIKQTLRRLLADRFRPIATRVRIEDDPASLRGTDGIYYAERFSSCHLPETISGYFKCLEHLREGKAHGARV